MDTFVEAGWDRRTVHGAVVIGLLWGGVLHGAVIVRLLWVALVEWRAVV
jgi:hypothetical protein